MNLFYLYFKVKVKSHKFVCITIFIYAEKLDPPPTPLPTSYLNSNKSHY